MKPDKSFNGNENLLYAYAAKEVEKYAKKTKI